MTPRKGRDGAAARMAEGDQHTPVSRVLYLPADVVTWMASFRKRSGLTNTQIVLRAINAHWRDVDELVHNEQRGSGIAEGDLFAAADLGAEPAHEQPRRQVEITPTGAQLALIDPLVKNSAARDRSHLVALTVRAYLEQHTI